MAFQFKIQIKDIADPPVWRRVLVPGQFTFLRMHQLIQSAFGWDDYHLFQFSPKGYGSEPDISLPSADEDVFGGGRLEKLDAAKTKLQDIFKTEKQHFVYIYDFGDDWKHLITLEKITDEKILRAALLDGNGCCPPEDCGGPWGYENLKEVMANPKHPEYKEMKNWLSQMMGIKKFDAGYFNLEVMKKLVVKV